MWMQARWTPADSTQRINMGNIHISQASALENLNHQVACGFAGCSGAPPWGLDYEVLDGRHA